MSQDITEPSDHCYNSRLLSMAKQVVKWIGTHPLYISYLVFFSPYILKLLYFPSPLLVLLLAAALCTFSTSNSFHVTSNEIQDSNMSTTPLEAEAYNIIFDTFRDSVTSLSDESDEVEACKEINYLALAPETVKSCYSSTQLLNPVTSVTDVSNEVEAYKQIKVEELPPEIVKSCCSSTPLLDPPLHEIAEKTDIYDEYEQSTKAEESEDSKSSICDENEIIKHMVCSIINEHQTEDDEQVKPAVVEVETNKAERTPLTTPTMIQASEKSDAAIDKSQIHSSTSTTTDLHKTNRSYDFSTIGSMRREKEWRRTLACKLFEERHNNRGGEDGMDMLWETIEESIEPREEYRRSGTMSRWSSRSAKSDQSIRVYEDDEEEGDDEEEEEDVATSGKMCCLQALKMSSGKVNLGIKSKNMIKISKAMRGFGWLHKTKSIK